MTSSRQYTCRIRMARNGCTDTACRMAGESPLSLVAGLILTMMAMQFSYSDSSSAIRVPVLNIRKGSQHGPPNRSQHVPTGLPKLGYLTMLDIYIVTSFCLLSLAAALITLLTDEELREWHATKVAWQLNFYTFAYSNVSNAKDVFARQL